jgi:hypothetical protein
MSRKHISLFYLFLLFCFIFLNCTQKQETESLDLRDRVKKIVLENGMTFLLLKRGQAPVFSAQLDVKVGSIEEKKGESGLAHFFEHMAFKGTDKIGTKDFSKETHPRRGGRTRRLPWRFHTRIFPSRNRRVKST